MPATLLNAVSWMFKGPADEQPASSQPAAPRPSPPCHPFLSVRHAAGEIEPAEVLGARDGVSKHGPIRRHELHDVRREPGFEEDLVDGVAGEQGSVAGLPQNHVSLRERGKSGYEERLQPKHGYVMLKCSGKSVPQPTADGTGATAPLGESCLPVTLSTAFEKERDHPGHLKAQTPSPFTPPRCPASLTHPPLPCTPPLPGRQSFTFPKRSGGARTCFMSQEMGQSPEETCLRHRARRHSLPPALRMAQRVFVPAKAAK